MIRRYSPVPDPTTIHYFDRPGDVFEYGVDSLPLFIAALRVADADDLVERHRHRLWLEAEIAHYYATVVDPATGLVRSDRKFSAHRDTVVNRSNAFGNTMVALLAKTIAETGWFASPFERHFEGDHGRLLMQHCWDGDHFRDALDGETVSGEANIWPFYTGVIGDPVVVAAALEYLHANGFCDPYPLRYETSRRPEREVWLTRHILPDYQGSTVWTSLGAMYLQVLRTVDPALAATETARYVEWIERDGTFWEVMNAAGQNWVSPRWIMIGEESMLWSAIFLDVLENGHLAPAAIPTAAVAQRLAAVVSPRTEDPYLRIAPAPRNPIPETICAAIREGSVGAAERKKKIPSTVNATEPSETRICVRIPAGWAWISRSNPIAAPSSAATSSRSEISSCSPTSTKGNIELFRSWVDPQVVSLSVLRTA